MEYSDITSSNSEIKDLLNDKRIEKFSLYFKGDECILSCKGMYGITQKQVSICKDKKDLERIAEEILGRKLTGSGFEYRTFFTGTAVRRAAYNYFDEPVLFVNKYYHP